MFFIKDIVKVILPTCRGLFDTTASAAATTTSSTTTLVSVISMPGALLFIIQVVKSYPNPSCVGGFTSPSVQIEVFRVSLSSVWCTNDCIIF